jgi:hypothetical protein
MSCPRMIFLTSLAMIAFAGNSLLCRAALKHTGIDAASFTSIRLLSGAMMLWLEVGQAGDRAAQCSSDRGDGRCNLAG